MTSRHYLQDRTATATATLTAADWGATSLTQTIAVSGVAASNTVLVTPDPASYLVWGEHSIYCTAQGDGTLTFACIKKPKQDITVQVVII